MSRIGLRLTLFFLVGFLLGGRIEAQTTPGSGLSGLPRGTVTNFLYAQPNELTIVVSVLGEVRQPGRYEISRNINLLDLLALAGGWTERSDPSEVTIIRMAQSGQRADRRKIRLDLTDMSNVKDAGLMLEQGDIVQVALSSGPTTAEWLGYISTAATIATTALAVLAFSRTR